MNVFLLNLMNKNIKYANEISIDITILFREKYKPNTNESVVHNKLISF